MNYQSTLLAVKDIERSKKFYCDLFGQTVAEDYGLNVAFDSGIALQQEFGWLTGIAAERIVEGSHNMELYFEEERLDDFLLRLERYPGIEFLHRIKSHDWGQRVIRIYDPDRHLIEIGEPMETVVRRMLCEGCSAEETARRTQQPLAFVRSLQRS